MQIYQILKQLESVLKMLAYWPYKVLSDDDADETLETFQEITNKWNSSCNYVTL